MRPGSLMYLPPFLIRPASHWAATAKTRNAVTVPFLRSYSPNAELNSSNAPLPEKNNLTLPPLRRRSMGEEPYRIAALWGCGQQRTALLLLLDCLRLYSTFIHPSATADGTDSCVS